MIDVLRRIAWLLAMIVTTPLWALLMAAEALTLIAIVFASWLRTGATVTLDHVPWLLDRLFAQIDRIKPGG